MTHILAVNQIIYLTLDKKQQQPTTPGPPLGIEDAGYFYFLCIFGCWSFLACCRCSFFSLSEITFFLVLFINDFSSACFQLTFFFQKSVFLFAWSINDWKKKKKLSSGSPKSTEYARRLGLLMFLLFAFWYAPSNSINLSPNTVCYKLIAYLTETLFYFSCAKLLLKQQ